MHHCSPQYLQKLLNNFYLYILQFQCANIIYGCAPPDPTACPLFGFDCCTTSGRLCQFPFTVMYYIMLPPYFDSLVCVTVPILSYCVDRTLKVSLLIYFDSSTMGSTALQMAISQHWVTECTMAAGSWSRHRQIWPILLRLSLNAGTKSLNILIIL